MPQVLKLTVPAKSSEPHIQKLWKEGLIIDHRPLRHHSRDEYWSSVEREDRVKFICTIEGDTLSVYYDGNFRASWGDRIHYGDVTVNFLVYDPAIETVALPSFDSKLFTFHNLAGESTPLDAEEVIIDSSVKVIRRDAFKECKKLERCIIGKNVEKIECRAFSNCESLKSILIPPSVRVIFGYAFKNCLSLVNVRLPAGLTHIRRGAFSNCESIKSLFIPPSVLVIDDYAFEGCKSMKILVPPPNLDCPQLRPTERGTVKISGNHAILISDALKPITNSRARRSRSSSQYDCCNPLPLFQLCADPDVTERAMKKLIKKNGTEPFYFSIQEHGGSYAFHKTHDQNNSGLTPLHIIVNYNAYASLNAIVACYEANPRALFVPDADHHRTPLDYLWEGGRVEVIAHILQDLCLNRGHDKKSDHEQFNTTSIKSNSKKRNVEQEKTKTSKKRCGRK